ncbi:hypothetical protein AB205_0196500, partial [Aquarana catesbeiana]
DLIQFMTSGPIVAMEVIGDEAIASWRKLLGPTNSSVARSDSPESIRARFGTDGTKNAAHGSDSIASAARYGAFDSRLRFFVRQKLDVQTIKFLSYVNSTSNFHLISTVFVRKKNCKSKTTHAQKWKSTSKTSQHIMSLLTLYSAIREFSYGRLSEATCKRLRGDLRDDFCIEVYASRPKSPPK